MLHLYRGHSELRVYMRDLRRQRMHDTSDHHHQEDKEEQESVTPLTGAQKCCCR
jgi:hypothetical protein